MLVTLQYGPLAGQERHVERNQITQLLLDLRLIELVQVPAPSIRTGPIFRLAAGTQGRWGISCIYPSGESRFLIHEHGNALPTRAAAETFFGNEVWDGTEGKRVRKPLPVPEEIWKQFLAAHGA